ncbi:MAG: RHS repeat-associated core domain-containing protein [Chromatiales bacterium]
MCAATDCTDSNSLPRTEFGYQGAAPSFARERIPAADPLREYLFLVSDFDGDGTRDMLRATSQYLFSAPRVLSQVLELSGGARITTLPGGFDGGAWPWVNQEKNVDADGDGRTDVIGSQGGHFAIATFNPATRKFEARSSNLADPINPADPTAYAFREQKLADFDADGRMDVLRVERVSSTPLRYELVVHFQCPRAANGDLQFCRTANLGGLGSAFDDCEMIFAVEDFDGNGFPDLLTDQDPTQPGVVAGGTCGGSRGHHVVFLRPAQGNLAAQDVALTAMGGPVGSIGRNVAGALKMLDVNGDGFMDFIHLPTSSPAIAYINEGGNQVGIDTHFRAEPIGGVGVGAALASLIRWPDLNHKVKVADVDGDGRAELLVPVDLTGIWCELFENRQGGNTEFVERCSPGANLPNVPNLPPGSDRAIYRWDIVNLDLDSGDHVWANQRWSDLEIPLTSLDPDDHFGDGLTDLQFRFQPYFVHVDAPCTVTDTRTCAWEKGYYYSAPRGLSDGTWIARNRGPASDLLATVIDGVGASTRIHYAPLSSTEHVQCTSARGQPFYRADYASFTPDGKHSLFTSSMHVVSRLERENGAGGLNGTCFRYANAWIHREGRGFLGFGEITEEEDIPGTPFEQANNLRRIRRFHRDFPLTGLVHEETEMLASDSLLAQPLVRTRSTWTSSCRTPAGQLARICFPYLDLERKETRELAASRAVLGTVETDDRYRAPDLAYGNLSSRVVTTTDAHHTQESTITYHYDYSAASSWWIDRMDSKVEALGPIEAAAALAGPTGSHRVVTEYEYWTSGNGVRLPRWERVQKGHADQALSTYTLYDRYRNPTVVRQEAARATPRRTFTTYTADGYFPEVTTNALGHATTVDTDPIHGQPTSVTDPNGNVTTMIYDAFGRGILTDAPDRLPVHERLLGCAGTSCPPRAVLREVRMQAGAPTRTRYLDRLGRPVRETTTGFAGGTEVSIVLFEYDARGRKVAESQPTYDPAAAFLTRWLGHDALGRPMKKTADQSNGRAPIEYRYFYPGLDTRILLPGVANPIVRSYDSQGRLVRVVDPYGRPSDYRYDPLGNLALIQDALGSQTVLSYDDRGRKVSVDHPDRGTTTTAYDGFDQAISTVDARGITVQHSYDRLGRPTRRSVNSVLEAEWTYDQTFRGALDSERGGTAGVSGYCRGFEYDSFGKPVRKVTFTDGLAFSTSNAYDAQFGRVKAVRYPSGRISALDYTDHGHLKEERNASVSLRGSLRGLTWSRRTTAMTAHGQVRTEYFGNALHGTYRYDPATGRPTWLSVLRQLTLRQNLQYAYDDPQGGLSQQSNAITGVAETFGYDDLSRLDWTTRTWSGPGGGSETVDYQYDAIGNLVVKGDYSTLTSYGKAGRANPANAGPHAIGSYRATNGLVVSDFRYDASGNLLAGDGRTAKYDAHDEPVFVEESGSAVRYAYGPNHERYKRVTGAGTTYYVDKRHERIVAGGNVTERDYVGDKVVIIRLTGRRLGIVVSEQVQYLHPDRLGSVDTITDQTGAVAKRQGFDPFGGPRDEQWRSTPTLGNPVTDRGFTGHEQVDDVHLVHMGGRAYDYRLGRFLSVDPFVVGPRDMQSLNAYSYVRNDPTGRIDPTGYLDLPEWWKKAGGWTTTYLAPSSGRLAAGDPTEPGGPKRTADDENGDEPGGPKLTGDAAAVTPSRAADMLKGKPGPSQSPEDTGAPGKAREPSRVDQILKESYIKALESKVERLESTLQSTEAHLDAALAQVEQLTFTPPASGTDEPLGVDLGPLVVAPFVESISKEFKYGIGVTGGVGQAGVYVDLAPKLTVPITPQSASLRVGRLYVEGNTPLGGGRGGVELGIRFEHSTIGWWRQSYQQLRGYPDWPPRP